MKCPICGAAELISGPRDLIYTHKGESLSIRAISGYFCPACREAILTADESLRVSTAMLAFKNKVDASSPDLD
ncbi:type II toxin-antitoxin system MqsA family antitoxin [Pseudomonas aeruginosa]